MAQRKPKTNKASKSKTSKESSSAKAAKAPQTAVSHKQPYYDTPFGRYFKMLDDIDGGKSYSDEFGSILILSLVEEVGEMARAYLAKQGRKASNLAAQTDETYKQELGDLLLVILRFARIKKIDLDKQIKYSMDKIKKRKTQPKPATKTSASQK